MIEKCPTEPERNSSGERLYRDSSGDHCSLRTMIHRETEWVISRSTPHHRSRAFAGPACESS